jgi:hypothetical protein
MRKLFWCCTAALLMLVCSAYGTASYASRHPDSTVARFIHAGCTLFGSNPLYRAGSATVATAAVMLGSGDATVECFATKNNPCCCEREFDSQTEDEDSQQLTASRLPGAIMVEEKDAPHVKDMRIEKNSFSSMRVNLEELEFIGCFIVPIDPIEAKPAPDVMPYLTDEPECLGFFGFWDRVFQSTKGKQLEAHEECEPFPFVGPPDCQEDPAYYHQCPGCPFPGPAPSSGKSFHPSQKIQKNPKLNDQYEEAPAPKLLPLDTKTKIDLQSLLPARPVIDTTEYRPSDASPNENRTQGPF